MENKVISPCISICKTDPVTGYCYGCARTSDEKKIWKSENSTDEWKSKNLEEITTLNLLEKSAESLQIRDAQGFDRFKSGFFVDAFNSFNFMAPSSPADIDTELQELRPIREFDSIALQVAPKTDVSVQQLDLNTDFALLDDENTQKTGNLLTLRYEDELYIEQNFATKTNNINPFHVVSYTGEVKLNPAV